MTRNIARSSNGRTPGFGPVCGGSSPPRATTLKRMAWDASFCFM